MAPIPALTRNDNASGVIDNDDTNVVGSMAPVIMVAASGDKIHDPNRIVGDTVAGTTVDAAGAIATLPYVTPGSITPVTSADVAGVKVNDP
jgi:hypothetical protein